MKRFRVAELLWEAVGLLVERRRALLQALIVPAACAAALEIPFDEANNSQAGRVANGLVLAVQTIAYSVFAVSCHRILLLGASSLPNRWGVFLTGREARFVGWSLVIALMWIPPVFVASAVAISIGTHIDLVGGALFEATFGKDAVESDWLVALVRLPIWAPGWYIMARSSLVLPATAIDRRPSMARAWWLSRGNGWRLTLATGVPLAFVWIVGWSIGRVWSSSSEVESALVSLGLTLLTAFEVAVLSVSYRVLETASEEPQGDSGSS